MQKDIGPNRLFLIKDKMKYFVLFFLFLIQLTACKKDKLDIPDTGRKLVINGLITTDSLLNIRLDKSAYYNEIAYVQMSELDNAKVLFYLNSICIDSFHFVHNYLYSDLDFFYPSNYWSRSILPLPGEKYTVMAKVPGFPNATASTTVPEMVRIERLDTTRILVARNPYYPDMSNVVMSCNINFTDPGNETNYYMISVTKGPQLGFNAPFIRLDVQDPIVEEKMSNVNGVYAIAFSDKAINGEKYSVKISIDANEIGMPFRDDRPRTDGIPDTTYHKKVVYFRLYSITQDYYKYIQTLNMYKKNYGNPLTEPVMIYSNITGGYGIFAAAAVSSDSIVFNY
jgi:hypothetical protein